MKFNVIRFKFRDATTTGADIQNNSVLRTNGPPYVRVRCVCTPMPSNAVAVVAVSPTSGCIISEFAALIYARLALTLVDASKEMVKRSGRTRTRILFPNLQALFMLVGAGDLPEG
ncbi:hypothetical protein Trydic_g23346 [Trypoxylus dichotomus]